MFSPAGRSRLRDSLIALARDDADVVGAALVGSAARGAKDEWSDIDLVLQLAPDADEAAVVERFTRWMDAEEGTADTLDVMAGGVRYRVFLLTSSLQVDVSFWPHDEFRATTDEGFQLIFGTANPHTMPAGPDLDETIGMGWLYALHARSALARGKLWQAATMLDDLRNQILALACARHDLNAWHGREIDRLPQMSSPRSREPDPPRSQAKNSRTLWTLRSTSSSPRSRATLRSEPNASPFPCDSWPRTLVDGPALGEPV